MRRGLIGGFPPYVLSVQAGLTYLSKLASVSCNFLFTNFLSSLSDLILNNPLSLEYQPIKSVFGRRRTTLTQLNSPPTKQRYLYLEKRID